MFATRRTWDLVDFVKFLKGPHVVGIAGEPLIQALVDSGGNECRLLRAQEVGILFRLLQIQLSSLPAEYIAKHRRPQVRKMGEAVVTVVLRVFVRFHLALELKDSLSRLDWDETPCGVCRLPQACSKGLPICVLA